MESEVGGCKSVLRLREREMVIDNGGCG